MALRSAARRCLRAVRARAPHLHAPRVALVSLVVALGWVTAACASGTGGEPAAPTPAADVPPVDLQAPGSPATPSATAPVGTAGSSPATGPGAGDGGSYPATESSPSDAAGDATPHDAAELDLAVIVDLAVDWRPEGELDADQVEAQRRRIRAAEDAVVEALGPHGRVRRRLPETAQLSLAVDDEGLRILQELPEVAAIHRDTADPTN